MTENSYIQLQSRLNLMQEQPPPAPWRPAGIELEGVTAAGFANATEHVLILTHDGKYVFDCSVRRIVAEAIGDDSDGDPYPVESTGIGPLRGQRIRLAGLWGGGLRTMTPDGWALHRVAPNWPRECVILCPPESPELLDDPSSAYMIYKDSDVPIRSFGFSDSGHTLIVATTEIRIWIRDEMRPSTSRT